MRASSGMRMAVAVLAAALVAGCRGIHPPDGVSAVDRALDATGYCRCGRCCGWKRTWFGRPVYAYGALKGQSKRVGITANGARARVGTIAADTRVFPFGTVMHVPGYGYGRVEDRGGAIKGDRIDLFFASHRDAEAWGRQRLRVKVWLPPPDAVGRR